MAAVLLVLVRHVLAAATAVLGALRAKPEERRELSTSTGIED
jgi:hypothetical protein